MRQLEQRNPHQPAFEGDKHRQRCPTAIDTVDDAPCGIFHSRTSLWLLRTICGIKVEWRGVEKIPQGACIVAGKQQSLWERFSLYALLDDPTYVLKRELMWIPLFGWHMRKAGLIPIDRSAGISALSRMTARARKELGRSRQVVIFPEGTRRRPGAEPSYKPGVAHLYAKAGVPCVPLALNSGLFWPRRSLLRRPGHHSGRSARPDRARARCTQLPGGAAKRSGRRRDGAAHLKNRAANRKATIKDRAGQVLSPSPDP